MIDSYRFGEIVIDGKRYTDHIVISGNTVRKWWPKEGHLLCPDDLAAIIKEKPEVVIIGTGKFGEVQVPQTVLDYAKRHKVRLICQVTDEACRTYNDLAASIRVAAALHLTC